MEGYTSKLILAGINDAAPEDAYDILGGSISFGRAVDEKGRPSSHVMGGQMSFAVEITDKTTLVESMLDPMNKVIASGEMKFTDAGADTQVVRAVKFTNAYIISYHEGFSAGGGGFACNFTISAEKIEITGTTPVILDNRWPVKS